MKNRQKKTFATFGVWLFALLFSLMPALAGAQTFDIDVDPANTSDPAETYYVGETSLKATINNFAGFTNGDKFYYYYVPNGGADELIEENILDQANYIDTWTDKLFSGMIDELGDFDLYVGNYTGRFDYETELTHEDVTVVYGATQPDFVAGSNSEVYSLGDIETEYNLYTGGCNIAELTVTIPDGAVITGVDVQYDMTAASGAWLSEQRSRIACISAGGVVEVDFAQQGSSGGGTQTYTRSGLDIANGVMGGGDITFEMQAYRTWGNGAPNDGCGTYYTKVDNGTWSVTVNYELGGFPYVFENSGNRSLTTSVFALGSETVGDVFLETDFTSVPTDANYPVVVEYSTNGTAWTILEDQNTENEFAGGVFPVNFELPADALTATTQFRVRQLNSASLAPNVNSFELNAMFIYKGADITPVVSTLVNTYTIEENIPSVDPVPAIVVTDIIDITSTNTVYHGATEFGQTLTVIASTSNITLADFNYLFGYESYFLEYDDIRLNQIDADNGEIQIDFTVPNHLPYNDAKNIMIAVIDGTEPDMGSGASNYDFVDDFSDEELGLTGGYTSGNVAYFVNAGERQMVTPEIEILSKSEATLQFTVTRLSSAIPAVGNEIVIEYSTDGQTTWTQLGTDYPLGGEFGIGVNGKVYTFEEAELPAGIVSANTQFRIRQLNTNNGGDVNTWKIENFMFDQPGVGNNLVAISDMPNDWIIQNLPSFTVELDNPDMNPIYPGQNVSFIVDNITGVFYPGTTYEVYYGNVWLKTLTTLADFDIVAPFDEGYKTITVRADFKSQNASASASFTIQSISAQIASVDYDIIDSETEYSIPGDDVEVTYDFTGDVGAGVETSVMLQVYNPVTAEFEIIGTQAIDATIIANQSGTITAQLPEYAYGATTDLRIFIENYPLDGDSNYDKIINRFIAGSSNSGGFDYYQYGMYNGLNIAPNSKIAFNIFANGDFAGDIEFVYSVNGGSDWVSFNTISVTDGTTGYVSHIGNTASFVEIPEELIGYTGNVWFGVRHSDELANIDVQGIRVISPRIVQSTPNDITINVLYPSVTLADLDATYNYGETIDLQYTSYAITADRNAWFAITIEQAGIPTDFIHVIAESDQLGQIDLADVQLPTREELTALGFTVSAVDPLYQADVNVKIYAYTKADFAELTLATEEETFVIADFLDVAGYNVFTTRFDQAGDRYAITQSYDFSETNQPVNLLFDYAASIGNITMGTLPYLQVSNDGGQTFTTLTVDESVYSDYDRLPSSGSHSFNVEIPTENLTSNTTFRWFQEVTVNSWWQISSFKFTSGYSNLVDFDVAYYNIPQSVDIVEFVDDPYADYNNLNTYDWWLIDADDTDIFEPSATIGQNFDYTWEILLDVDDNPVDVVWPAETVFEFSITGKDETNTDTTYVFATTTVDGALIGIMNEAEDLFIKSGLYNVSARAIIYDVAGEEVLHAYPAMGDAPQVFEQILVVNETTQEHREIILQNPVAVNADVEDTDFYFGSQMEVTFEEFGPYEAGVRYQVVFEGEDINNNDVYLNVEDYEMGGVYTIDIPTIDAFANFDLDDNVFVKVYAYMADEAGEEFVYDQVTIASLNVNNFLVVNNGNDVASLTFNGSNEENGVYTERVAVTRKLSDYVGEGVTLNEHRLVFDYTTTVSLLTMQTVPRVEISINNGETYSLLSADYLLLENGTYAIDLTQEMLDQAADVHFRWIQEYPEGSWTLSNVAFVEGESNWYYNVASVSKFVDLNEMSATYPDTFANYEFEAGTPDAYGLQPAINVAVDTDFSWTVIDDEDVDNVWPIGTMFQFTMDVDGEIIELNTFENAGVFTAQVPELVPTGEYTIAVRAMFDEGADGEYDHYYPGIDPMVDPIAVKTVLVINQTAENVRKLIALDLPIEDGNLLPEYSVEENVEVEYELYGEWDAATTFAATLEQFDGGVFLERTVLEQVSLTESVLTVKLPAYEVKNDDWDHFEIAIYPYEGDAIAFGDEMDVEMSEKVGVNGVNLDFALDGDRYAITEEMDLSEYPAANINFTYYAWSIVENQNTLPQLLVSTDGVTFEPLEIDTDISDFGAFGYLPANASNMAISVDVPAEYLTATTTFKFKQDLNRGFNLDRWYLMNVKVVAGANITANYLQENTSQEIDFIFPDVNNYVWEVTKDADGFEPAIYSGDTFQFNWAVDTDDEGVPVGLEFPTETTYDFYIVRDNNGEDELIQLAYSEVSAGVYETTLPENVQRDDYSVYAHIAKDDFVYIDIEDEVAVGVLHVFNPLLITKYADDEVLYAGNDANFTADVHNEVTDINADWYYNLILTDQWGDEWLLAAQQGSVDFSDVTIPTFIKGNRSFEIKASIGAEMGIVGEKLEGVNKYELVNADFENSYLEPFTMSGSEGAMVTLTSNALDFTNYTSLEFDVMANELDLLDEQKMVLEYSIDGGVSFTEMHSYPDERFTEEDLGDYFEEVIAIPAEAQTEETQLRWRIEEYTENFKLQNIVIVPFATDYEAAPMSYKATSVPIAIQRIDVEASELSNCNDGVVELNYVIRGKFGADNVVKVSANGIILDNEDGGIEFTGITEGMGTMQLFLNEVVNAPTAQDWTFRLYANDETIEEYEFSMWGANAEYTVEVIPEFANSKVFARQLNNYNVDESCVEQERFVVISSVQDHFSYQLRNYITAENIGTAVVIDTEDDDLMDGDTYPYYDGTNLKISLGAIDEPLKVEALITAQDGMGELVCGTSVPNYQAEFDVRPAYTMHYDMDGSGVWIPVTDGQEFMECADQTDGLRLSMGYWKDGVFVQANPIWYRNDLSASLGTSSTLDDFNVSADYFAVVDDGACGEYQSVIVNVEVNEMPEQPEVVAEGNTDLCEGETTILTATAGYNYYKWYRNGAIVAGNAQTFEADQSGSYQVAVSDIPFEYVCYSQKSNPVYIDIFEFNNVSFTSTYKALCHNSDGIVEFTLNGLQDDVVYQLIDDATEEEFGETFTSYAGTSTFETTPVTTNMIFSVVAVNEDNESCSKIVNTNTLTVELLPEFHTLINIENSYDVVTEGTTYCEFSQLAIGNEIGMVTHQGTITWFKDGVVYPYAGSNFYFTPIEAGVYNAKFTFGDDCSYFTEEVTVGQSPERPLLTYEGQLSFCEGEGDLIISGPEGYTAYEWYRNGSLMSDIEMTDNQLHVTMSGDYQLLTQSEFGCESRKSESIDAVVHTKPNEPYLNVQDDVLCEAGYAVVRITNAEASAMYQLYNVFTGEATGAARMGANNLILRSDSLFEETMLEVRASRLDVNSCASISQPVEIGVYNLTIIANGNTLIASITENEAVSYQWYRDGMMMQNGGNGRSINIYDGSQYEVIVVTVSGCEISSVLESTEEEDPIMAGQDAKLTIHPNPAQDYLIMNYSSANDEQLHIKIYNTQGNLVYEANDVKSEDLYELEIPVSDFIVGTYVIQVVGQKDVKVQQFFKY